MKDECGALGCMLYDNLTLLRSIMGISLAFQLSDCNSQLALSFSLSTSYGAAKLHPFLLYGLVVTVIIWSLWALHGESGFGFIYGWDSGSSSIASLWKTATSFEGRRQQRMASRDVRCIQLSWNVELSLKTKTVLHLTFDIRTLQL